MELQDKIMKTNDNNQNAFGALPIAAIMMIVLGGTFLIVGLFLNATVSSTLGQDLTPAAAVGTYTITGNTSTGEYVNITTGSTNLCYYFNTTGIGKPIGCLVVDVRSGGNTSIISATNLTASMNGDSDFTALLTATNPANNTTVVTAKETGINANSYTTTDTVTNGSWGAATLAGGIDGMSAYPIVNSNVNTAFQILGVALIFGGIGVIIGMLLGFGKGTERK